MRRMPRKEVPGGPGLSDHAARSRLAMTPPMDLARLRARDPELLGALVRELSPQLLAVIGGFARDDDHASDLLQECWVQILERLEAYRPSSSFAAWAIAVTRNVCRSSLRREGLADHAEVGFHDLADVPSEAPGHDERTTRQRLQTALFRALDRLPDREREAIVLRVLEGRGVKETAQTLGVSRRSVGDLVQRGLYRIRRMRAVWAALEDWLDQMS